jgi:predicted N-acetyltransferase YhbS
VTKHHVNSAAKHAAAAKHSELGVSESFLPLPARLGDHHAIHLLLQEVFGGPSAREFQAELEQPGYTPCWRQIMRDGAKLIGHVRIVPGTMQLAAGTLPIARLCDFAMLTPYRGRGLGSRLLAAAEQQAAALGAQMVLARSDKAAFFERQGWFPCGQHIYSCAGPREILAELDVRDHGRTPQVSLPRKPVHEVTVRRWKQTEYAAIQRLYREGIAGIPGPLLRSEEQWRWLIGREAYDWLYLAIEGPDQTTFDNVQAHIIGYMILKTNRVVELMTSPQREDAARALLMRACRDAIEQDVSPLRFDAPIEHPFHRLFAAAGGQVVRRECEANQWRLAKVLNWPGFLSTALATLRPGSLSLEFTTSDQGAFHLQRNEEAVRCEPCERLKHPPGAFSCRSAALAQLLMGHSSLAEADARGSVQWHQSRDAFASQFPSRSLWMPPLEEMLAE